MSERPPGGPGLAAVLVPIVAGCAVLVPGPAAPRAELRRVLPPYASFEECLDVARGLRLDYRFESDQPVAFAVRYRDGSALVAPLSREQSLGEAGFYAAPFARHFCLAWEAGRDGARLSYQLRIRESP